MDLGTLQLIGLIVLVGAQVSFAAWVVWLTLHKE